MRLRAGLPERLWREPKVVCGEVLAAICQNHLFARGSVGDRLLMDFLERAEDGFHREPKWTTADFRSMMLSSRSSGCPSCSAARKPLAVRWIIAERMLKHVKTVPFYHTQARAAVGSFKLSPADDW